MTTRYLRRSLEGASFMKESALRGRSLLSWLEYTPDEIVQLLDVASRNKIRFVKTARRPLRFSGRTVTVLSGVEEPSLRVALETAFGEEGGRVIVLPVPDFANPAHIAIEDLSRILGRMTDCIFYGGGSHKHASVFATYSAIPVISAGTTDFIPLQILADLMTLKEERGSLKGSKLAFVGDCRGREARTLMTLCPKLGVDLSLVSSPETGIEESMFEICKPLARDAGTRIEFFDSVIAGVSGADAILSAAWLSGTSGSLPSGVHPQDYRVDTAVMVSTGKPNSIYLHGLPARKGEEVSLEVIEGPQSRILRQAENRKHIVRALLLELLPLPGKVRK